MGFIKPDLSDVDPDEFLRKPKEQPWLPNGPIPLQVGGSLAGQQSA